MEHHVYFAVFGYEEDALAVTLIAGVEPDDIWRKGESYSEALPDAVRTENRWFITSGLGHDASHSDHFEKLLRKLERLGDALATLRDRYRCGIGVSRYYFMDDPEFYLSQDIIEGYRRLGFEISFDQLGLDNDQARSVDATSHRRPDDDSHPSR